VDRGAAASPNQTFVLAKHFWIARIALFFRETEIDMAKKK
jgi:hypothetical protein